MNYRPNIRPNYSVKLAEYSVSADTTFCPIGRSLYEIIFLTIFQGYKYFGFDPETLCHIKSEPSAEGSHQPNEDQNQHHPLPLVQKQQHHQISQT